MKSVLAALAGFFVGCGGGSSDGGPSPGDAPSIDAGGDGSIDSPFDAAVDVAVDAANDAPTDAPPAPPSYMVVETNVDIRADIDERASGLIHIRNTGGSNLGFTLQVAGEDKSRSNEQPLSSGGCTFVAPGDECIASVDFFPLSGGDRVTTVTIHPATAGLADTTLPVLARTFTRVEAARLSGGPVGSNPGVITSSSPDVSCTGTDCSGHFLGDMTLTATPSPGYVFVAWSEASCGSSPTCLVPRSTTRRAIGATFTPVLAGQVTVDMTGAPAGARVLVYDESFSVAQSVLAYCATNCTVPLPSDVSPTPVIRIVVYSPRGTTAITGACSGTDRCTFPAATSAAIAVRWTFDPKLLSATMFDLGMLRSVSAGANGELFVSTISLATGVMATMKLDASGNVVWAYPWTGQVVAMPDGGVAVSYPTVGSFADQRIKVLRPDGYEGRFLANQVIYGAPVPQDNDIDHFARVVAVGANGMLATPGVNNSNSAIEAWGQPFPHWNATITGQSARSLSSNQSGAFYVATRPSTGDIFATAFSSTGLNQGTVLDVARDWPLMMVVSAGGDIVTTSGTSGGAGAEIALRRTTSAGQRRFERRLQVSADGINRAGVIMLSSDDVMWIRGYLGNGLGSYVGSGFIAERVDSAGNVVWSLAQLPATGGGGLEVYDLAGDGTKAYAVGGLQGYVSQSWLGVFAP